MTDLKTDWETGDTYHPEDANTIAEYINAAVSALTALTIAAYVKPGDGIPVGDLSVAVQSALAAATSAYQKPVNGISSADMAAAVQSALTKADSAVQPTALDVVAAAADAAKNRANHTGVQTAATISDFTEAVQDAVAALLAQGTGVTLDYNDAANTLTITSSGGGGGLDAEAVRDAIGVALIGSGLISVTVNDAADTITISTTATANSTDAALRDRSTHTGTQPADTITETAAVKMLTAAERTKLTGVAAGATANATDAALRDRSTHTGTQSADTVVDGTANKAYTAAEKTKLGGIATGATANATDTFLRDRTNHTGSQAISTITNLQTTLDGKEPARIRSTINSASTLAALSGQEYIYLLAAGALPTFPTAVGNTSLYWIVNTTGSAIDLATTSSQQINGAAAPFSLPASAAVTMISDNAGWRVI